MNTPPPDNASSAFTPSSALHCDDDCQAEDDVLPSAPLSHKATAYSVAALVKDGGDPNFGGAGAARDCVDGHAIANAFCRVNLSSNEEDIGAEMLEPNVDVNVKAIAEDSPAIVGFEPIAYSQGGKSTLQVGSLELSLENISLWDQFKGLGTEMIITKAGRRMFPPFVLSIIGMDKEAQYAIYMDVEQVDDKRYKYLNSKWIEVGKAEKETEPRVQYHHPESPNKGSHWMGQKVSFKKMKLTNNKKNGSGHLVLNSMHKYQPRIHIVRQSGDDSDQSRHSVFVFPDTIFIAVTAYQNDQVTQLKIDNNPFAKAFRDSPQENDLRHSIRPTSWHPYYHSAPPYASPAQEGHFFPPDFTGHLRPYGQMSPYYTMGPWEYSPVTPSTPYQRQEPVGVNWTAYDVNAGGSASSAGPTPTELQPPTSEANFSVMGTGYPNYGYGLVPSAVSPQVPLTPVTPSLDPYAACSAYGAGAGAASSASGAAAAMGGPTVFGPDSAATGSRFFRK